MARFFAILGTVWLGVWAWSFIQYGTTEPSGDGFTRGFNRVQSFFMWQLVALTIAIPIWLIGTRQAETTREKWLSRAPILLGLLPFLLIVAVVASALLIGE